MKNTLLLLFKTLFFLLLVRSVGLVFANDAATQATAQGNARVQITIDSTEPNAGGALAPQGFTGFDFNRTFLRGFPNESALRNGLRDYGYLGPSLLANIESIEILKGPASALYGNGKTGGDINTVSKLPGPLKYRNFNIFVNDFGYKRLQGDFADSLDETDTAKYRLNFQLADGKGFRDKYKKTNALFAPVLSFKLSPDTALTFDIESLAFKETWDIKFIPLAPLLSLPAARFLGEPFNQLNNYSNTLRTALEHRFSPNLKFREALFAQYAHSSHLGATYDTYGLRSNRVIATDGRTINRVVEDGKDSQYLLVSQSELYALFSSGSWQHEALIGVELGRFRYTYQLALGAIASLDAINPQYGSTPSGPITPTANQRYGTSTSVLYAQDRITLGDHVKVLLGVRAERFTNYYREDPAAELIQSKHTILSPRLGIVFEPKVGRALFLSITNSARPQIGAKSANGQLFQEEDGGQLELGTQVQSEDKQQLLTFSLFQITKKNTLTTDPVNPNFQIAAGERQSRGVDVDYSNQLTEQLRLDAKLAYVDSKVSKDLVLKNGSKLAGVAARFVSLYGTYDFRDTGKGFSFGVGLVGEAGREASLPSNGLRVAGYATVDLSLAYKTNQWAIQGNINNAFDRKSYQSDGFTITPNEPRSLNISLRYKY